MSTIEVFGMSPARAARVAREFGAMVARLGVRPMAARATFFDDDGPKGGKAIRCALTTRLPRVPTARVEHTAEAPGPAFDGALAKLERQLLQRRRRQRDSRRRPKKYFAARLAY